VLLRAGEREQAEGVQEQPGGVPPCSQRKEAQGALRFNAAWSANSLSTFSLQRLQEGVQQQQWCGTYSTNQTNGSIAAAGWQYSELMCNSGSTSSTSSESFRRAKGKRNLE
jgi:hypothetical protein